MAKKKARQSQPNSQELGLSERWKRWLSRNEKILWVGLLVMIAPLMAFTFPVESFLSPQGSEDKVGVFYGEPVTVADIRRVQNMEQAVRQVVGRSFPGCDQLIYRGEGFDPLSFCLYTSTADRLGIRVSDAELAEHIRDIWRGAQAARLTAEELATAEKVPAQNRQMQWFSTYMQKQEMLRNSNAFDEASWKEIVGRTRLTLSGFESALREFFVIAKLQTYVADSVVIDPKSVFAEFEKEDQERRLSWAAWKPNEALSEKVAASITDDDLKIYYDTNPIKFEKPLAVRASYIQIPKEHFVAEVEKKIEQSDLEEHYSENQNDYRTPAIRADETLFALRTPEEQDELDNALFKPLEEVEAEVRESLVEEMAGEEMRSFSIQLTQKLYPRGKDDKAVTPDELAVESPFLKIGETDWGTQADAEEAFGDLYNAREVQRWLQEVDPRNPNAKSTIEPSRWPSTTDDGQVLFTKVDVRQRTLPPLEDVREEVKAALVKSRAVDRIAEALTETIDRAVESESAGSEDAALTKYDAVLEQVLADGVEVTVADSKVKVMPDGGLVAATDFSRSRGSLKYLVPVESEAATDDGTVEDETREESLPYTSSGEILRAGFDLPAIGQLAAAADSEEETCYLVRYDELKLPDPAKFEDRRRALESQLRNSETSVYVTLWKSQTLRKADPTIDERVIEIDADSEAEAPEPN